MNGSGTMAMKDDKIKKILKQGSDYVLQNNAYCFLPGDRLPRRTADDSLLGRIQDAIKKFGNLYYFLVYAFGPVKASRSYAGKYSSLLKQHGPDKVVVNLGSGPTRPLKRGDIINIDCFAFDEVDIVADARDLPIESDTVDLMINNGLIEHTDSPQCVVREMSRVLRPGGVVFCFLPFMQPYHAAPDDYYRWTIPGIRSLFHGFGDIEIEIAAGPTSGMLWVLQEWLAILLSFGSRTLHDAILIILMVLTAPVKLLDIPLVHFPHADKIASGFHVTARKKEHLNEPKHDITNLPR